MVNKGHCYRKGVGFALAKILLADDSTHAQRMGTKILSAEGHEVTAVSNGQAAFKLLKGFVPDLIVADIFMPGRSGYELCQLVKADPQLSYVPVLLIVGAMEPYDPEEGKRVGADGVVTKPLESSDLIATVQRLLAGAIKPAPPPVAEPAAVEEPAVFEAPQAEPEMESFQASSAERLEIPKDIGEQPLSVYGDFLRSAGETAPASIPEPTWPETPSQEEILLSEPMQESSGLAEMASRFEVAPVEIQPAWEEAMLASRPADLTKEEGLAPAAGEIAPQLPREPEPSEKIVWAAEPVPVAPEDEKLFKESLTDWGSLTKMVEAEGNRTLVRKPLTTASTSLARNLILT